MPLDPSCAKNVFDNDPEVKDIKNENDRLAKRADELNDLRNASVAKKAHEGAYQIWVNGLLSNPFTHFFNVASTASFTAIAPAETAAAVAVSKVRPLFGAEPTNLRINEASSQVVGMAEGIKDAWKILGQFGKTGEELGQQLAEMNYNPKLAVNSKISDQINAISADIYNADSKWYGDFIDLIGQGTNLPGQALNKADLFFKMIASRGKSVQLATRRAYDNLDAGIITAEQVPEFIRTTLRTPPKDIVDAATEEGDYRAFTDDLTGVWETADDFIKAVPPLRWMAPFRRTLVNMTKRTIERTPPGGLLKSIQAEGITRDEAIGRAILATTAAMSFTYFMDDKITGRLPKDRMQRDLQQHAQQTPFTFEVAGVQIPFDNMGPVGDLLKMATHYRTLISNLDLEDPQDLAAMGLLTDWLVQPFTKYAYESTWGQNFGQMMTAIDQAMKDNQISAEAKAISGLSDKDIAAETRTRLQIAFDQFNGSFVPAIVSQTSKFQSPQVKDIQSTLDALLARIPFLTDLVPSRYNVFGEPMVYDLWRGFGYIDPAVSNDTKNIASTELLRLQMGFRPTAREINHMPLTRKEREQYAILSGQGDGTRPDLATELSTLIKSSDYRTDMSDYERRAEIRNIVDSFREEAKAVLYETSSSYRDRRDRFDTANDLRKNTPQPLGV